MRAQTDSAYSARQFENCLQRVAEGIEDRADLDHALKFVHPDSRVVVRAALLERVKPILRFTLEETAKC